MTLSYSDLVLGLCVNADTYDDGECAGSASNSSSGGSGGAEQLPCSREVAAAPNTTTTTTTDAATAAVQQEQQPRLSEGAGIQADEDGPECGGGEQLQQPFPAEALGRFDFRLKPTNFAPGFKTVRSTVLMDWDEIKLWYQGQTLLKDLERREYVVAGLRWTPFVPRPPAGEPVVRHPTEPLDEEEGQCLRVLRDYGVNLRPVWVDGDGSCLVHAVSTALTGSQLYYDALRWAAHKELRDHAAFYQQAGFVTEQDKARFLPRLEAAAEEAAARGLTDREKSMREAATQMRDFDNTRTGRPKWTPTFVEEAIEKARPSEGEMRGPAQYLEEIHVAALANALRRPIMILAEGFQGGLFLPLRHDPEDCRLPASPPAAADEAAQEGEETAAGSRSGPAAPPIFVFLQYDHYIPLVHQSEQDFWAWANGPDSGFAGDEAALEALRMYEAERGGINHRIPEFAEEILTMCVGAAAQKMEEMLSTYEVLPADREAYRQAFGRPERMEALPLKVIFEEHDAIARCDKTVKNLKTMNALFRALGMEVNGEAEATPQNNVVYLSLYVHQVDFARYHRLAWALYYLMSCQYQSATAAAPPSLTAALTPLPPSGLFPPTAPSTPTASSSSSASSSSKASRSSGSIHSGSMNAAASSSFPHMGHDQAASLLPQPPLLQGSDPLAAPLAETGAALPPPLPRGVLPSAGNVDQSVFKFVLNYSQNDDLNLGLARLYCEPEGWDLRPMLFPARDPRDFLTRELARLEARFQRLTGLDYRRVMDEDVAATAQAGGALGGLGGLGLAAPTDFRAKVPKALLALQSAIRTRPYPGRGTLQPSHIFLEQPAAELLSFCAVGGSTGLLRVSSSSSSSSGSSSSSSNSNGSGDQMDVAGPGPEGEGAGGRLISLAQVRLASVEARRELLRHLLVRGLPQNQQFEQAACAVLLPERFNEARARFCFLDWLVNAANAGLPNLEVEQPPSAVVRTIRKITVRPLPSPARVPALAALFPAAPAAGLVGGAPVMAAAAVQEQSRPQQLPKQHHRSGSPSPTSSSTSAVSPRSPSPDPESEDSYVMLEDPPHHHHEEEEGEEEEEEQQQQQQHANPDPNSQLSSSPAYKKAVWHVKQSDGTAARTAHVREPGGSHRGGGSSSSSSSSSGGGTGAGSHSKKSPSKGSPQGGGGGEGSKDFVALGKRGTSSPF